MSGTLSLREAALATVTTRLVAQLPDVVVERARRSAVDADADTLPLLVVTGEDLHADDSVEPGATHYRVGFSVSGYARASTDLGAEQALSHLHARVVAALVRWTPSDPGLTDPAEQDTTFLLFDAEDASQPAGSFFTRFTLLAVGPTGGPWSI